MSTATSQSKRYPLQTLLFLQLPLITAVLVEAHLQFLFLRLENADKYLFMTLQLMFESLPFFIAHQLSNRTTGWRAMSIWLCGFLIYPLLSTALAAQHSDFNSWRLLSTQGTLLTITASLIGFISQVSHSRPNTLLIKIVRKILSLNTSILLLLIGWALVMAGAFNTHHNPMYHQPINLVIDVKMIFTEFAQFMDYFWQFLLMAGLTGSLYTLNRYMLIRRILAKSGVIIFAVASLLSLLIFTPLLAQIALWLPLNQVPAHIPNLLPSGNQNIFAPYNYQFTFGVLAITTPLILAFERQQQDAKIAQIAQQKTHTELQLLQQQVNPHFLFNTLNNLYALTLIKSEGISEKIMQLANLLRYTVYEGQKSYVSLAQEVAYLKDYVALQQIRSGAQCRLQLKWPEQAQQWKLPPLLLMIPLENAFKHGIAPKDAETFIRFELTMHDSQLRLYCENSVMCNKHQIDGGLGLDNLNRRLMLLYPGKHHLQTEQTENLWRTTLTMELEPCSKH